MRFWKLKKKESKEELPKEDSQLNQEQDAGEQLSNQNPQDTQKPQESEPLAKNPQTKENKTSEDKQKESGEQNPDSSQENQDQTQEKSESTKPKPENSQKQPEGSPEQDNGNVPKEPQQQNSGAQQGEQPRQQDSEEQKGEQPQQQDSRAEQGEQPQQQDSGAQQGEQPQQQDSGAQPGTQSGEPGTDGQGEVQSTQMNSMSPMPQSAGAPGGFQDFNEEEGINPLDQISDSFQGQAPKADAKIPLDNLSNQFDPNGSDELSDDNNDYDLNLDQADPNHAPKPSSENNSNGGRGLDDLAQALEDILSSHQKSSEHAPEIPDSTNSEALESNEESELSDDLNEGMPKETLTNNPVQNQPTNNPQSAEDLSEESDLEGEKETLADKSLETSEEQTQAEESIEDKIDKLQKLKELLQNLASKVNQEGNENKTVEEANRDVERRKLESAKEIPEESFEEKYDPSEHTNQELRNRLNELVFEDRERGPGYAIDTNGDAEVPDSVIRTLINRFLNQRYILRKTDLNTRSSSLTKTHGYERWDVKKVVTHLVTKQYTQVLEDKYGFAPEEGSTENIPLSFYFDLSGSMSEYTNLLATIAIELLKKDIKVLVGFNERVNYQINSVSPNITVKDLARVLTAAGQWEVSGNIRHAQVDMKYINRNIDNYLINAKAEKCVVFTDFDPIKEVKNLSKKCQVYWFNFKKQFSASQLNGYQGFMYTVQNITDIALGLLQVSEYRFEALCYIAKDSGWGKGI